MSEAPSNYRELLKLELLRRKYPWRFRRAIVNAALKETTNG